MTPALRDSLKTPLGVLYLPDELDGERFLGTLRASPVVITVGDRVTESLHVLGRTPDVQVVDEVERRVRRTAPDVPFVRLLRATNPAGTVTAAATQAIEDAMAGEKPARVLIDGEEDLLALPAVASAPMGASLYYGQPGEGVVLVKIDERAKASATRIMGLMDRGVG